MKLSIASSLVMLASLVTAPAPHASEAPATQYSMLVEGKINVSPQGDVIGYSLNDSDKLPQGVVNLLKQAIPKWRFLPPTHDGKAVALDGKMSVRVIAKPRADNKYDLSLGSYWVGADDSGDVIRNREQDPPRYPAEAIRNHASGTVFFVMQVDKTGHVTKAAVQQINLFAKGRARAMARARKLLADATLAAVQNWTFDVPTTGPLATLEHWNVRSRISYELGTLGHKPGRFSDTPHWKAYIPGPKQNVPWLNQPHTQTAGVDALPDGGVYLVDRQNSLIPQPHG